MTTLMTNYFCNLIGTFCIVNASGVLREASEQNNLIGTFCIVNHQKFVAV